MFVCQARFSAGTHSPLSLGSAACGMTLMHMSEFSVMSKYVMS